MTLFLVVNDGGTSVFDPILVNRWGNFCPKSGGVWRVFYCCFLMSVFENASLKVKRNRWMVDRADCLIAYLFRDYGGAYETVKYAKKQGKPVINLAE